MTTACRVWAMYQARCLLCGWSGEIQAAQKDAADDARHHRSTQEHRDNLKEADR